LRIAARFGVTVSVLQSHNSISNPNSIRIGQLIRIPATSNAGNTAPVPTPTPTPAPAPAPAPEPEPVAEQSYRVQSGDTLLRIAARFGVTVSVLQTHNNISNPNSIRIGQLIRIPTEASGSSVVEAAPPAPVEPETVSYRVKAGDTLWSIARQFGVSSSSIVELNGISNINLIRVGQLLQIKK
jgi:LysM repeat protein